MVQCWTPTTTTRDLLYFGTVHNVMFVLPYYIPGIYYAVYTLTRVFTLHKTDTIYNMRKHALHAKNTQNTP